MLFVMSITAQDLIVNTKLGLESNNVKQNTHNPLVKKFKNQSKSIFVSQHLFSPKENKQLKNQIDQQVKDAITLQLNQKELYKVLQLKSNQSPLALTIPVDEKHAFRLMLSPAQAITEDFFVRSFEGDTITLPEDESLFYNGYIEGDSESFATLTLRENFVRIVLSDKNGNYVITPITNTKDQYILFNDAKLTIKKDFGCGNDKDDYVISAPLPTFEDKHKHRVNNLKIRDRVEVYVEVDYDLYVDNGSSFSSTYNYVLDLFRETVSFYEKEQVSLRLNQVAIWTTNNDPFNNIGADFDALEEALEDWASDGITEGDIGHYISPEFRNNGDGTISFIGLANGIGGFCDLDDGLFDPETSHCASLGMSTPFVALDATATTNNGFNVPTWQLEVFIHEMGHVFGSRHTHACVWGPNDNQAIDNCATAEGSCSPGPAPSNGGTIMSYCNPNNLANGFGSEPGAVIRSTINNSDCIDAYVFSCPDVETLESDVNVNNSVYDATSDVLVHDATVIDGISTTLTAGDQTIIYGNFTVESGAGLTINLSGCTQN